MHDIDQTTGKAAMAYVGEKPWHGLGGELRPGAPIEEWKVAAGLDWKAVKSAACYVPNLADQTREALYQAMPDRFVLHRNDTGAPLCVVSHRYQPVQPGDVLDFFRDLTEKLGIFELETAGALRGGKKIWALARAADPILLGDDMIARYILLATSFDMTLPTQIRQTSIRVVCQNTLSAAMGADGKAAGIKMNFSHRTAFNGDMVKEKLGLDESWTLFRTYITKLANAKANDPEKFFSDVFGMGDVNSLSKRRRTRMDKFMEIYETAPGQDMPSADKTLWGLLNAVTYFVDHEAKARDEQNRLDNAWFGLNNLVKDQAFKRALELVPVAA